MADIDLDLDFELDSEGVPHNPHAEQCVIGLLLSDPERTAELMGRLKPDDFEQDATRIIWLLARRLFETGQAVSISKIYSLLAFSRNAARFALAGGMQYLQDLLDSVPPQDQVQSAIQTLLDTGYRRRIVRAVQELGAMAAHTDENNPRLGGYFCRRGIRVIDNRMRVWKTWGGGSSRRHHARDRGADHHR